MRWWGTVRATWGMIRLVLLATLARIIWNFTLPSEACPSRRAGPGRPDLLTAWRTEVPKVEVAVSPCLTMSPPCLTFNLDNTWQENTMPMTVESVESEFFRLWRILCKTSSSLRWFGKPSAFAFFHLSSIWLTASQVWGAAPCRSLERRQQAEALSSFSVGLGPRNALAMSRSFHLWSFWNEFQTLKVDCSVCTRHSVLGASSIMLRHILTMA